jgi:hypothetical protein
MLAGGYSWRLFFYVEFAFAMGLFILAFFFVEETAYDRESMRSQLGSATVVDEKGTGNQLVEVPSNAIGRKSFAATLKPWSRVYPGPFFSVMLRSFTYFLVPSVFWVVTTYGKAMLLFPSATANRPVRHQYWSGSISVQLHFSVSLSAFREPEPSVDQGAVSIQLQILFWKMSRIIS